MNKKEEDDIKKFWDNTASDWEIQVGNNGDSNRRLNSDPILWKFAGDVHGLKVLDAGCGTGYLTKQLSNKGAIVTGIDISDTMVEIAKKNNPESIFYVDSCTTLETLNAADFDLIISNYVLMDTPELCASMKAFNRILKLHGTAILIFSHPCFPQGRAVIEKNEIRYCWDFSYFDESHSCPKQGFPKISMLDKY
jgi:2-polyprenyl-3-methyl-5-hydroxy-6-metoxy-1,4-benzoquinol methylase